MPKDSLFHNHPINFSNINFVNSQFQNIEKQVFMERNKIQIHRAIKKIATFC